MKLSIIIPTFNEERTIAALIQQILETSFPIAYELILVDDHSSDRTLTIERALRQQASRMRMQVLHNRTNKGKGACIRQGIKHATGELVIVQDGDLEYRPADIPMLLAPLLGGEQDLVVFGSRFLGQRWPKGMAPLNLLANRFLTWLTNRLFGLKLTDMECCYKVIPMAWLTRLRLHANRFESEPELVAKLARCGVQIIELPVHYHGRSRREGKKIRVKDFFLAIWMLLRVRVSREPLTNEAIDRTTSKASSAR